MRERVVQFAQGLVEHEQEAVSIMSYQSLVVPGLLQTRDYCRAVFDYRYPAQGTETAEQWVNTRMDRQLVWQREQPPVAHFILEEAVLRRQVGGPDITRRQIRQILEYTEPVHMSMQIMPMGRTPHACLDGPMVLLETPDHERWCTWKYSARASSSMTWMRSATITFSMECCGLRPSLRTRACAS